MSKAKASNQSFSAEETAFFEEGDTLAEGHNTADFDFSDLEPSVAVDERASSWAERAMAVLSLLTPRTQS